MKILTTGLIFIIWTLTGAHAQQPRVSGFPVPTVTQLNAASNVLRALVIGSTNSAVSVADLNSASNVLAELTIDATNDLALLQTAAINGASNSLRLLTVTATNDLNTTLRAIITSSGQWVSNTTSLVTPLKVGIGNVNPQALLHVGGSAVNNSEDAQVLISRLVNDPIGLNGHAFSDSSTITRGGGIGYNSYDGRVIFSGTNDFNHYAVFQSGPAYSSSGTLDNLFHFYASPTVTTGAVVNNYGMYLSNPTVTGGRITNNYGIFLAPQTAGSVLNYALYNAGTARIFSQGTMIGDKLLASANAAGVATKQIEVQSSDGTEAGLRLNQGGQNTWDFLSPASTTRFDIRDAFGTNLTILTGGNVGLGTPSPLARLHVGASSVNNSEDAQVLISRLVNDTVVGNGHAFSDSSTITRAGGIGYNSYDARAVVSGANSFNHYAAFQAGPTYGSSGTLDNLFNFFVSPTVTNGAVKNNYGLYITNPTMSGSGAITNNYGIYLDAQTAGNALNYALYNAGSARIFSQGTVIADKLLASANAAGVATKQLEVQSVSGTEAGLRLNQAGNNFWDIASVANSTSFSVGDSGGTYLWILNGGNVGIGTNAPGAKLHVSGGVYLNNTVAIGASQTTILQEDSPGVIAQRNGTIAQSNATYRTFADAANYSRLEHGYDATKASYVLRVREVGSGIGNSPLMIQTTATNLVLTTNGNVGMGTTPVAHKLDVKGTSIFGTEPEIAVSLLSDSTGAKIGAYGRTAFANAPLIFLTGEGAGNTEKVRISPAGNLGVGTNGPATKLHVNGAVVIAPTNTINLTSDDTTVSTVGRSYLKISSDSAVFTDRTFILTAGSANGHMLKIHWVGTNTGELVDDAAAVSGNHRLAGSWIATQYDSISLTWDGTDWIEDYRSTN